MPSRSRFAPKCRSTSRSQSSNRPVWSSKTKRRKAEVEGEEVTEIDEEKLTVFKQFIETLDIDDLGKGGGTEHKLS